MLRRIPYKLIQSAFRKGSKDIQALRVWMILRCMDENYSGWVFKDIALPVLTEALCYENTTSTLRAVNKAKDVGLITEKEFKKGTVYILNNPPEVKASKGSLSYEIADISGDIRTGRGKLYEIAINGLESNSGGFNGSRETITRLLNVSAPTQRVYEEARGIIKFENIGILYTVADEKVTDDYAAGLKENVGASAFIFTDYKGLFGRFKQKYVAKRLPNTYETKETFKIEKVTSSRVIPEAKANTTSYFKLFESKVREGMFYQVATSNNKTVRIHRLNTLYGA